jgi:hypothetical protein
LHDSRKTRITKFALHKGIAKKILVNDRSTLAIYFALRCPFKCRLWDRRPQSFLPNNAKTQPLYGKTDAAVVENGLFEDNNASEYPGAGLIVSIDKHPTPFWRYNGVFSCAMRWLICKTDPSC